MLDGTTHVRCVGTQNFEARFLYSRKNPLIRDSSSLRLAIAIFDDFLVAQLGPTEKTPPPLTLMTKTRGGPRRNCVMYISHPHFLISQVQNLPANPLRV